MEQEPTDELSQSWEANAAAWTRAVREGRIESRRLATDSAVLGAVLRYTPERVLDVGCGEGWLCRALAEQDVQVMGVDGSGPLIEAAQSLGGGQFVRVSFEEIAETPAILGKDSFDAVVCNFALLDREIIPLLCVLRSRLRPSGVLIIQTVHPCNLGNDADYSDGWRTEDFAALGGEFVESMPWYARTLSSWTDELGAAGLVVASIEEPRHPTTKQPLSLLFVAMHCGTKDGHVV